MEHGLKCAGSQWALQLQVKDALPVGEPEIPRACVVVEVPHRFQSDAQAVAFDGRPACRDASEKMVNLAKFDFTRGLGFQAAFQAADRSRLGIDLALEVERTSHLEIVRGHDVRKLSQVDSRAAQPTDPRRFVAKEKAEPAGDSPPVEIPAKEASDTLAVKGRRDPRVAAPKLAPAKIFNTNRADDIAHRFFWGIRKLKAAGLRIDFDLVGGETVFLGRNLQASAQGERGEVVECDILRCGPEVQRQAIFRAAAPLNLADTSRPLCHRTRALLLP